MLLAPALVTGLVLAGVIGELNGWVIPRFLRSDPDAVATSFEYGLHVPQRAVAAHER